MTRSGILAFFLAATVLIARVQAAPILLVDQESTTIPTFTTAAVATTNNKGQTFTPNLSGLDAVDLRLGDADIIDGLGATFQVNIRENDLFGAIVGSSLPTVLPDLFGPGFQGAEVHFDFAATVPLTSVSVFAMELVQLGGGPFSLKGRFDDPYAGGDFLQGTNVELGSDLWFREGLHVPEPATLTLAGLGLIGLLACGWRRRKRYGAARRL